MRNIKVGRKMALILGITLVMFIGTLIIVAFNMDLTNAELDTFYRSPYQVRAASREMMSAVEGLAKSVLRMAIANTESVRQSAILDIEEFEDAIDNSLLIIEDRFLGDKSIVSNLENEMDQLRVDREKAIEMAKSHAPVAQLSKYMEENNFVHINAIRGYIYEIIDFANHKGESMLTDIRARQQRTMALLIVIGVASALVSILMGALISRSITAPLSRIKDLMNRIGETGDIYLNEQEQRAVRHDMQSEDEIGQTVLAYKRLTDHITAMAGALKRMADKDLSDNVVALSDRDVLGNSMIQMQSSLNRMFAEMQFAATQVSIGSGQIADGAQALAQGVTEQSAVIEQLGSSMLEIMHQTDNNVALAQSVRDMGLEVSRSAELGSQQMAELVRAIDEIGSANKSVIKIIGMIEDIAFQTNILSLNAAIEAARAGEHGRGFAVIVQAVRELAAKSAEAAETIHQLIGSSTEKTDSGTVISARAAKVIDGINEGTQKNVELVLQIAQASGEQSAAINQVVTGISQVAEVVHRNSATAEQSAAASEEMSRQAHQLREYLAQFKIRQEG